MSDLPELYSSIKHVVCDTNPDQGLFIDHGCEFTCDEFYDFETLFCIPHGIPRLPEDAEMWYVFFFPEESIICLEYCVGGDPHRNSFKLEPSDFLNYLVAFMDDFVNSHGYDFHTGLGPELESITTIINKYRKVHHLQFLY